jgi:ribosomal protein S18 acetylase RimI-like enzyme
LLDALRDAARSRGFAALSLSVEPDNLAAVRLYERKGFVRLFADEEGSWTMKADLSVGAMPDESPITERTEER